MAVVTRDYLEGIRSNFRALFETDFQAAQAFQGWEGLVSLQPSNNERNVYNWFGTVPRMQDVTSGQVARQGLASYNFAIVNKEWQSLLEVERAALERDQLGLVTPRINQMSMEAARHPGEMVMELVEENPDLTWQDGSGVSLNLGPYFDSGPRTIGNSNNIDNIITGGGATTIALIQADLGFARARLRLFTDDEARPMNRIGNFIMVPPALEQIMVSALTANVAGTNSAVVPATQTGLVTIAGYQVMVNPYLTDENDWYLFHTSGAINRPFIQQVERSPELASDTNPDAASVIESRKFLYSAYGRYNVGVSDPRFAIKVENT